MSVNVGVNQHIELVKKWLADKDSVSLEQLEANKDAANAARAVVNASYYASYFTYAAAASDATEYAAPAAAYWVKRYEELIDE